MNGILEADFFFAAHFLPACLSTLIRFGLLSLSLRILRAPFFRMVQQVLNMTIQQNLNVGKAFGSDENVCLDADFEMSAVGQNFPQFASKIENVTVNVGRTAILECHVNHLGKYKVSGPIQPWQPCWFGPKASRTSKISFSSRLFIRWAG